MASMVIRNIPDELMARIKETARREGKSAEQLAREALAARVKPAREEAWSRIDTLRSKTRRIDDFDIVGEINQARETRTGRALGKPSDAGT